MKKLFHSRCSASKGAALIIVLALVVLLTGLALAHFSRSTTNRRLAQSSYTDTSADLLTRSGLDIIVGSLKQEIVNAGAVTQNNIQPQRCGVPADPTLIPNLIRRSARDDGPGGVNAMPPPGIPSGASAVNSGPVDPTNPQRGEITSARWNSHYLIPPGASFTAPDWVLVTAQGPNSAPAPNAVIGRYAFAVYDEGGLIDLNLGGFPTYASVTRPTRPARRLHPTYPLEESEIILAAFTPNPNCHSPKFTPNNTNASGGTGAPFLQTFNTNGTNPQTFSADFLPHGLSIDPSTGTISGVPTSPGGFTITLTVANACGNDTGTLNLTINGRIGPDSTPWPINLARKGTWAFADLTALPSNPAITTAQINKLMGWRNYATTQQPPTASFDTPSFPPAPDNPPDPTKDLYAQYFLGAFPPPNYVFTTPFTIVSAVPDPQNPGRTDQAVMTRQELIKLQRTIGFSQSLLQYLGTFSRERNHPAPDWSQTLTARWDMNNLQGVLPDSWLFPGNHGVGHAFGKQRHSFIGQQFGLQWVAGNFTPGTRLTDPNYYGRWKYIHNLNDWSDSPDFFQIINNAMKIGNGGVAPAPKNVFTVGAALIDQYDTEDLFDPDPNPPNNGNAGNTITIIDTVGAGHPADYVNGIEGMSFDDPTVDMARPGSIGSFCPYPPPVPLSYVLLNRRFENVGEFGYAYNPASDPLVTPSRTLDFASANSHDKPLLDFFTYNTAGKRAGIVNLNTRNGPVLASIIRGAWVHDPGGSFVLPPDPTYLVSQTDALAAGQAIVRETTSGGGPVLNRADVARLAAVAASALHQIPGASDDEKKQTIARALAEVGQTRTWNLMIDLIAQTGKYKPNAADLSGSNFVVEGEKRYWLHIALGRDLVDGQVDVLGSQLEEVTE